MYYYKLFYHVEIFAKKVFGGCKSQIFLIGYQIAGRGDERRGSET